MCVQRAGTPGIYSRAVRPQNVCLYSVSEPSCFVALALQAHFELLFCRHIKLERSCWDMTEKITFEFNDIAEHSGIYHKIFVAVAAVSYLIQETHNVFKFFN